MKQETIAGITVNLNEDGYLANSTQWTREIGIEIAREEGIILSEKHFTVIEFLRNRYSSGENISIRSIKHSGILDIRTFYHLFPGAALKKASRIAGIPKPSSCV